MPKSRADIIEDLAIRNPTLDDAQRTLDLMVLCDLSEYDEPDADMQDLLFDWSQIDLTRDAWLALTPDGDVVGYGAVLPWFSDMQYSFYIDPSWESLNLGQELLARCDDRGFFLAEEREGDGVMLAKTYIAHVNQRDREIVKGAGFHLKKYIFQMRIEMDSTPREPRWPLGISVRTAVPNQDDRTIYELIQSAFDQPGRTPPSKSSARVCASSIPVRAGYASWVLLMHTAEEVLGLRYCCTPLESSANAGLAKLGLPWTQTIPGRLPSTKGSGWSESGNTMSTKNH
jgi:GNAT superfamily N-acetyltransferase